MLAGSSVASHPGPHSQAEARCPVCMALNWLCTGHEVSLALCVDDRGCFVDAERLR